MDELDTKYQRILDKTSYLTLDRGLWHSGPPEKIWFMAKHSGENVPIPVVSRNYHSYS